MIYLLIDCRETIYRQNTILYFIEKDPTDVIVLNAISQGAKKSDKIEKNMN